MATATANGATRVVATAYVDGVLYSSAVARGSTAVAAMANGVLVASARVTGGTAVQINWIAHYAVTLRADGVTTAVVIYVPDLFGPPGDPTNDPTAPPPITSAPPIQLGLDLRGACSIIPPALELL